VTGPAGAPGQVFITQRLARMVEQADAEAKRLKDDYVSVEHLLLAERRTLPVSVLFVFIGAEPCTGWLAGSLALDERGYVRTGRTRAAGRRCWRRTGPACWRSATCAAARSSASLPR
jgi:thioredoxin reductase